MHAGLFGTRLDHLIRVLKTAVCVPGRGTAHGRVNLEIADHVGENGEDLAIMPHRKSALSFFLFQCFAMGRYVGSSSQSSLRRGGENSGDQCVS